MANAPTTALCDSASRAETQAYGFIPVLLEPADYATIHGHDERLSLENIRLGTQVIFELVRRIAT